MVAHRAALPGYLPKFYRLNTAQHIPAVSVVLPVYNASSFVHGCITSLLAQRFSDFELIVLNDGSTDDSWKIITAFGDARVRAVQQEKNRGLSATLNHGISLARAPLIARMDADDLCGAHRFERQVQFMRNHPETGVLGTGYYTLGERQRRRIVLPLSDAAIRCRLLFASPLAHPTVMFRASCNTRYPDGFEGAEDFACWTQLAATTTFANLPESLLTYRIHPAQESKVKAVQKRASRRRIMEDYLRVLGCPPVDGQMDMHLMLSDGTGVQTEAGLQEAAEWLVELHTRLSGALPEAELGKELALRWVRICASSGLGLLGRNLMRSVYLIRYLPPFHRERIKATLKLLKRA